MQGGCLRDMFPWSKRKKNKDGTKLSKSSRFQQSRSVYQDTYLYPMERPSSWFTVTQFGLSSRPAMPNHTQSRTWFMTSLGVAYIRKDVQTSTRKACTKCTERTIIPNTIVYSIKCSQCKETQILRIGGDLLKYTRRYRNISVPRQTPKWEVLTEMKRKEYVFFSLANPISQQFLQFTTKRWCEWCRSR